MAISLDKRPIGATGIAVTPIAFGATALAGMPDTYGYDVSEAEARATIHAIFDSPVNVIDTSRNYGFGRSEERIGAAIAERGGIPDGFVLSTKIDRDMDTLRLDADRTRRSLEESLAALNVDRVGILHLHDPEYCRDVSEITREGGALDELFRMKEEGLAGAVGLAMGKIELMSDIVRDRPFDCIISHNRFTLINRQAEDLFEHCRARGIAVFNAAPYASGVLARGADAMPLVTYQDATEEMLAPVRAVERICAEFGVATGAAALQFSLRDPRVTSTIVGISSPEHLTETLHWAAEGLGEPLWDALAALPASREDPEKNRVYKPG
jgi:D-threo-aldose 1-dehydrogenase